MPHIVLEYPATLPVPDLADALGALHRALAPLGPFALDDFKSRAHCCDVACVGAGGARRAFAHVEVGVLDRRDAEVQRLVADATLAWLERTFAECLTGWDVDLTVEVREIRSALYRKSRRAPERAS
jgi:5-carboxymethyl-2-hydroxymuconate isomerase